MKRHTWPEELIGLIGGMIVWFGACYVLMELPQHVLPNLAVGGLVLCGLFWLWVQFHGGPPAD